MTLPKINDLSNDQIRAMIAEATIPGMTGPYGCYSSPELSGQVNGEEWIIPDYPTDANAALTLCAWMAEKHGWQFNATMHRKSRTWSVYFEQDEETHYSVIDQPTFALAVSRAFCISNNLAE